MSKFKFSTDDAMRVFVGSGDELADLRVRLLFNGYTPLPADGKGTLPKGWSSTRRGGQPARNSAYY
jgi:hypothetical protein